MYMMHKLNFDGVLADEVLAENDLVNSYEGLRRITGGNTLTSILDTDRFLGQQIPLNLQQHLLNKQSRKTLAL